jgi:hypothetical protein
MDDGLAVNPGGSCRATQWLNGGTTIVSLDWMFSG